MNAKAILTAKAARFGDESARLAYVSAVAARSGDSDTAARAEARSARLSVLAADYAKAARRAAH